VNRNNINIDRDAKAKSLERVMNKAFASLLSEV